MQKNPRFSHALFWLAMVEMWIWALPLFFDPETYLFVQCSSAEYQQYLCSHSVNLKNTSQRWQTEPTAGDGAEQETSLELDNGRKWRDDELRDFNKYLQDKHLVFAKFSKAVMQSVHSRSKRQPASVSTDDLQGTANFGESRAKGKGAGSGQATQHNNLDLSVQICILLLYFLLEHRSQDKVILCAVACLLFVPMMQGARAQGIDERSPLPVKAFRQQQQPDENKPPVNPAHPPPKDVDESCLHIACSNNGLCKEGICTCVPGWEGTDCSINIGEPKVVAIGSTNRFRGFLMVVVVCFFFYFSLCFFLSVGWLFFMAHAKELVFERRPSIDVEAQSPVVQSPSPSSSSIFASLSSATSSSSSVPPRTVPLRSFDNQQKVRSLKQMMRDFGYKTSVLHGALVQYAGAIGSIGRRDDQLPLLPLRQPKLADG